MRSVRLSEYSLLTQLLHLLCVNFLRVLFDSLVILEAQHGVLLDPLPALALKRNRLDQVKYEFLNLLRQIWTAVALELECAIENRRLVFYEIRCVL